MSSERTSQGKPPTSGLAITAFVFALLVCIPIAPLLGVGLGILALVRISKSQGALGGQGLAIAAVAAGSVLFVFNVGVFAAIGIPNFIRYQLLSKTGEARHILGAAAMNARFVAADNGAFPVADTGLVPPTACGVTRCATNPSLWTGEPWRSLGVTAPGTSFGHYFQYRYASSDGTEFELTATADLDGDGTPSLFRVSGSIDSEGEIEVGEVERVTPPSVF